MDDRASLAVASAVLESFGHGLVERFVLLNVWTAVLLAGALILDRALSRRARASLRVAFYAPVALRLLLPLGVTIVPAHVPRVDPILLPLLELGGHPAVAVSRGDASTWYALAAVAYFVVGSLLLTRAITARVRLARALSASTAVAGHTLAARFPVVQHDDLGPMVVGLFAPKIVIPRDLLAAGTEHALVCVLRHEAAHLRRRDAWLSVAIQFLLVAAWPVVPMWIAAARVRQLIELACDEAALVGADATERRRYGHALLDLTELRSFATTPLGAGELHFGSNLRARVEALGAQHHWPIAAQALVSSLAPLALFVACGGAAPSPAASGGKSDPPGYGYEFAGDSTERLTTAPVKPVSRPLGPHGRLTPEAIEDVVRDHFGAALNCYEVGRLKNPDLAGIITMRFVVGENGVPKTVLAQEPTVPDPGVAQCIVDDFKKCRFPESKDGDVTFVYPIKLGS